MSKTRSVVVFGLALILLAACERSSAVATRTEARDRPSPYETALPTDTGPEGAPRVRSYSAADIGSQGPVRQINGKAIWSSSKKGSDNIFAVATKDGVPRAMFKPDQGPAYWDVQKARETRRQTVRVDRRSSDTEG